MELYKKHRPRTLKRVIGNEDVVKTLNVMVELDKVPHTILFHGPSGCGKTTVARIMKRMLNCSDRDFHEINCADFRGIDTVREIMRNMSLSPLGGDARIYLIDECHKLSNDAQNAFLKALEDTPSHVYFFLCTTEPDRLIKTIRTRCCEFTLRVLTDDEMMSLLRGVARREKMDISDNVLDLISELSVGSPRTALVLLDKISGLPETEQMLAAQEHAAKQNEAIDLCRLLLGRGKNWADVASCLRNMTDDPESVRFAVLGYARAVLLKAHGAKAAYAWWIIECFSDHFWDSKAAGLAGACFRAIMDGPE